MPNVTSVDPEHLRQGSNIWAQGVLDWRQVGQIRDILRSNEYETFTNNKAYDHTQTKIEIKI